MRAYLSVASFVIIFCIVIIVSGLIGQEDYKIEAEERKHYISMVCSKAWPDYKNLSPSCD